MKPEKKQETVVLQRLQTAVVKIEIVGDTTLLTHSWSNKARKDLKDRDAQKVGGKGGRAARDPEQEMRDAMYLMPDGKTPALPTIMFKVAMANAAKFVKGWEKKTGIIRGSLFIIGDYVPVRGIPELHEAMVRLMGPGRPAQVRYRPQFKRWGVTLEIRYRPDMISVTEICELLNHAGFSVGVGEDRPEKRGNQLGQFHVASSGEVEAEKVTKKKKEAVA